MIESKRIDPAFVIIAVMLLLIGALIVFFLFQFRRDEVRSLAETGPEVPLLIMVEDNGSILLSHVVIINPKTRRVAIMMIPENLGGIIPALGRADSYESLFKEKGFDAYWASLEALLDYKIPFYFRLDLEKIAGLVDFLEGLPVFVPDSIDARMEDGAHIRIANGSVRLDGDKVKDYLRYQAADERELEISNRRWGFSKALLISLAQLGARVDDARFKVYLGRSLKGNLDIDALSSWLHLLNGVNFEESIIQRILGTTRTVDMASGSKELLFPHFDGKLVKDSMRQLSSSLASETAGPSGMVRLEILNGTDIPGLARKARDLYMNYGFEVVRFGNASSTTTAYTQVLDRKGDLSIADRVAKVIRAQNVSSQMIAQGDDPATVVDVTIILGKDFDGWYVRQE